MPFNSELGMQVFDPLAAYESGQPAAAQAARAFERGQSQADKARQILKRNMAVEAMKIDAAELYSHMEQTPENLNLAQRQAFLKNAAGIWGEETGLGTHIRELLSSDEANLVRAKASEEITKRTQEANDLRLQLAEVYKPSTAYKEAMEQASLEAGVEPGRIDLLGDAIKSRKKPSGLMIPGNINLYDRPKVKNADGTVSTVRSISVGMDGKEYLIPTVSDDGKILSNAEAIDLFKRTGKHLGAFEDVKTATDYANTLHEQQAAALQPPSAGSPDLQTIQKRALEIMQSKQNKDSSQESERKAYAKLIEQKSALDALVKGNPEDPGLRKMQRETNAELEMMRSQHKPPMTGRLEINPDGTISMGFGEGMATVGTQTATQGELANIKNSIVQIDQAMNVLTEKDLGVAGNVWDRLVNRYLVQLVPEAADPKVSSNRAQLQKAVDSYLQSQQRSGLRLSAPERAEVRDTLVSQSLGESLPRAQSVLHTMGKMQKFEAIARAKTGSQPLQPWMFNGLSQEEIKQLGKDKIITDQEMFDWASKAPMLRWVPPAQTTTPPAAAPPPYRSPSSQAPPGTVG